MQRPLSWFVAAALTLIIGVSWNDLLRAEEPAIQTAAAAKPDVPPADDLKVEAPGMEAIPIPADPELEEQIAEVQQALATIYQQMVRRKETIKKTEDLVTKTTLYEEFERLRKEREELETLLHDLVDEAKLSEQTAMDEALARARWFERRQEYWDKQEELIRDRQQ